MSQMEKSPATAEERIVRAQNAARMARTGASGTAQAGAGMAWRIWGSGPLLVLLHGGHGSWTHWIRNIPVLAQTHTVLVPDMPGYGDSGDLPKPHTIENIGRAVAAGIRELIGEQAFTLVGFSFGATVAGMVAVELQRQLQGLVLVGPAGLGLTRPPMGDMINWRYMKGRELIEANRHNLGVLMLWSRQSIDDLAVHQQMANSHRTRFRSREISHTDILRRCILASRPNLAGIWGACDATARGNIEIRALEILRLADPAASQTVIESAGHWVQYERADCFNAAILSQIRRLEARPVGGSPAQAMPA